MLFVRDLTLSRTEGLVMLAGATLYLGGQMLTTRKANSEQDPMASELLEEVGDTSRSYPHLLGTIVLGCRTVFRGRGICVRCDAMCPRSRVSTHVVGVTLVAFGTSVPEIAASLTAALKGNSALSIGNLVGSNI